MLNGEIEQRFKNPAVEAIGIVCGPVSGGLEVIDIDCKYDVTGKLAKDFFQLIEDNTELSNKLVITATKNAGWHIYYRCSKVDSNRKLAKNIKGEVLIETRGEGGYVIAPPSIGYELKKGNFSEIPFITEEDREILFSIAQSFDETEDNKSQDTLVTLSDNSTFDDFNLRGDVPTLLEKHGWSIAKEDGQRIHLKRPGNTTSKVSGNWHISKRIFYPFTTSTQFEAEKGYNAVQVYVILECNGDFSEASKRLYQEGFGDRKNFKNEFKIAKIPAFPIDTFPGFIKDFVLKCVETYATPIDYWAGSVIASTALAIGNKLELATKYRNVPVLWICLVGDVSSGKYEAQNIYLKPFKKLDADAFEVYKAKMAEYERISNLSKSEKADEGITENSKPGYFQYLLNDYTPESLAGVHTINSRGIMIERDELKGWLDDFNRYSKSGEQSNMLSTWSGLSITYNRKSSGVVHIDDPTILVTGGMQPDLLPTLSKDNRAENGFLARMCFFYPDSSKKPKYSEKYLPREFLDERTILIHDLTSLEEKTELNLSVKAMKVYSDWYNENRNKINNNSSGYLKGVFGKLDIIALRVAIVLKGMWLIYKGDHKYDISEEIMQSAIEITEYFRATSLKVYQQIFSENKAEVGGKAVAKYLHNSGTNKSEIARIMNVHRQQVQRWLK